MVILWDTVEETEKAICVSSRRTLKETVNMAQLAILGLGWLVILIGLHHRDKGQKMRGSNACSASEVQVDSMIIILLGIAVLLSR